MIRLGQRSASAVLASAIVVFLLGAVAVVTEGEGASTAAPPSTAATSVPSTIAPPSTTIPPSTTLLTTTVPTTTTTTRPPTTTTRPPAPPPTTPQPLGTWRDIAPAPNAPLIGGVAAWTGRVWIRWAGLPSSSDAGTVDDEGEAIFGSPAVFSGQVYDPATDSWSVMADGPVPKDGKPTQTIPSGVWTGDEMMIWGGWGEPIAAAYDPATDRWRDLPPGPLPMRRRFAMVHHAGAVYVLGGTDRDHGDARDGAVFDLATQTWRAVPAFAAPRLLGAGVLGEEVWVASRGDEADADIVVESLERGASGWTERARLPTDEFGSQTVRFLTDGYAVCEYRSDVDLASITSYAADGSRRWSHELGDVACGILAMDDRLAIPDYEVDPDEPFRPTSTSLLIAGPGGVDRTPPRPGDLGLGVWTGTELLFWGGCDCGPFGGRAAEQSGRIRLR